IQRIENLEARIRRRDLYVSDLELFRLFNERIPADMNTAGQLKHWLKREPEAAESALALADDDLLLRPPDEALQVDYPDALNCHGGQLDLAYTFYPGVEEDGITCTVPIEALNNLPDQTFEWLVPGLLREKMEFLLKSLPKRFRRPLIPLPRTIETLLAEDLPGTGTLTEVLAEWIRKNHGLLVVAEDWPRELPEHLRMRFQVIDADGKTLAAGRDLDAIRKTLSEDVQPLPEARSTSWQRTGIKEWDFGELRDKVEVRSGSWNVIRYPGLKDNGDAVSQHLFENPHRRQVATAYALTRLALFALPPEARQLRGLNPVPETFKLRLLGLGLGDIPILNHVIFRAVAETSGFLDRPLPRNGDEFVERIYGHKSEWYGRAFELRVFALDQLEEADRLRSLLADLKEERFQPAVQDMRRQLRTLFMSEFLLLTPTRHVWEFPRYLKGIAIRIDRLRVNPSKDRDRMDQLSTFLERCPEPETEEAETWRWMLEEWRISLFAQELRTLFPISAKRLEKQWEKIGGSDSRPSARRDELEARPTV
ncbi:MAG: DUF3418 domain-containing protein, partial [Verrucomicrobiota bacterium]